MVSGALTIRLSKGRQSEAQVRISVSQNTTHFTYQHHHLNYALLTGMLYGGQPGGKDIDFNASSPKLRAALTCRVVKLIVYFPPFQNILAVIRCLVSLNGTLRDFQVMYHCSRRIRYFSNPFQPEYPLSSLKYLDIAIANGQMQLNGSNSPLAFDGHRFIRSNSFSGTDVGLKDVGNPAAQGYFAAVVWAGIRVLDAFGASCPSHPSEFGHDDSDWNL